MNHALNTSSQARALERQAFVDSHWRTGATLHALPADASTRRYFRVEGASLLLMDSPPQHEPLRPYLQVAGHTHPPVSMHGLTPFTPPTTPD